MATACESDSEMQGGATDIGRDVLRQSSDSRQGPASSEVISAPIHRLLGKDKKALDAFRLGRATLGTALRKERLRGLAAH